MLKHTLIHPKINEILARAGHHSKVLIADGNYPASSTLGPRAELVSLNLSPGVVTCTQVLSALVTAIPIEAANTMESSDKTGRYISGSGAGGAWRRRRLPWRFRAHRLRDSRR